MQAEEEFIARAEAPRKLVAGGKKKAETLAVVPIAGGDEQRSPEIDDRKMVTTQPLRLNAYQYEQLKLLAANEDRSLGQVLRRLMGPALEKAVQQQGDGTAK